MITMAALNVTKTGICAMTTSALWGIVRHSVLSTPEATIRYVYAKAELRKRGFVVA